MGWFNFSFTRKGNENMTRHYRSPRGLVDWTEKVAVDRDLTYGLYHNEAPGLKLAGSLAYAPIAVPVWFMGLPVAESKDDRTQEILTALVEQFATQMPAMHMESHRDGTIWIWPYYSSEDRRVVWEAIPDTSVTVIAKSLSTGRITEIVADEQITVSTDNGQTMSVNRVRRFTRDVVETRWFGATGDANLVNETVPNISGSLPIHFSNNADINEVRGHSDYERIIYDLKNYHDIELMQSTILAKFNPKLVVNTNDPTAWLRNNGYRSINDVDVARSDLFLNLQGEEVKVVFPDTAHEAYEKALKRTFRKIVEGSVVPEICWGVKVEGNLASAEEQMGMLYLFVEDKRSQKIEPYRQLFTASLRLMGIARMQKVDPDITVVWGNLDKLSARTKAEVFKAFAEGAASLVANAAVTKRQLYELWNNLYPSETIEDYDEFEIALSAMAKHKQFVNADWEMARDEF